MQTLHETELSYTQDHKLDLNGMARTLLEDLVNTVMVEQVEELGCVRNGYRERKLVTSVGTLTLKILNSVKGPIFLTISYVSGADVIQLLQAVSVICGPKVFQAER